MQSITKNIRWRALMETYQTAGFDRSPNNLSRDIFNGPVSGRKGKKKNKKSKNNASAFAFRSKYYNMLLTSIISTILGFSLTNLQIHDKLFQKYRHIHKQNQLWARKGRGL